MNLNGVNCQLCNVNLIRRKDSFLCPIGIDTKKTHYELVFKEEISVSEGKTLINGQITHEWFDFDEFWIRRSALGTIIRSPSVKVLFDVDFVMPIDKFDSIEKIRKLLLFA